MTLSLKTILRNSSKEDLVPFVENLTKRFNAFLYLDTTDDLHMHIDAIADKFCAYGAHSVRNLIKKEPPPYTTVLGNCAKMSKVWKKINIEPYHNKKEFLRKEPSAIERIELAIVLNSISKAYKKLNEEQKSELMGLFYRHGIGIEKLDNLDKENFSLTVEAISKNHLLSYELSQKIVADIWQQTLGHAMEILTPKDIARSALRNATRSASKEMVGNVIQSITRKYAFKIGVSQWLYGSQKVGTNLLYLGFNLNSVSTAASAKLAGKAALKSSIKGTVITSTGVAGKAISTISGPIGWGLIGVLFSLDLMKPALRVILPGIYHICYLRQKLLLTRDIKDIAKIEVKKQ